jgi:hypothetical protein
MIEEGRDPSFKAPNSKNSLALSKRNNFRYGFQNSTSFFPSSQSSKVYDRDDDHLSLFVSILSPFKFYDDDKFKRIQLKRQKLKDKGCVVPVSNSCSFSQICSFLFPSGFLLSGCWANDLFHFFYKPNGDSNPPLFQNKFITAYTNPLPLISTLSSSSSSSYSIPMNFATTSTFFHYSRLLPCLSLPHPSSPVPSYTLYPDKPFCRLSRGVCRLHNPISFQFFFFFVLNFFCFQT